MLGECAENGFTRPFRLIPPDEAGRLATLVRHRILSTPSPVRGQPPPKHRHLDCRTLFNVMVAPEVLAATAHLGSDLMVWNSTLFDKAGQYTGPRAYPWHRESYYWKIEPLITLSFWIALEPATARNGCLEFLPGSHRWTVPMASPDTGDESPWFAEGRADERFFSDVTRVVVEMAPGECVAFTETVLHRSGPNLSGEPRLGFAFRIAPCSVRIDHPFPCVVLQGRPSGHNVFVSPPRRDPPPWPFNAFGRIIRRFARKAV